MAGRTAKPWRRTDRDGAWYAWIQGRRVRIADPEASDRDAQAALRAMLGRADRGLAPVESAPPTVAELILQYLNHIEAQVRAGAVSALTQRTHLQRLDAFEIAMGQRLAPSMRIADVEAWVASRAVWGPTMRSGVLSSIRTAFRWARAAGIIDANPLEGLKVPVPGRREKVLTPAQALAAIDRAPNEELRRLLRVLYGTGCRPSEAVAVEARDLDLQAGTWSRPGKTTRRTGRKRVVRIPQALVPEFRDLVERFPTGPVLRNTEGQPWTRHGLQSAIVRLRKITGLGLELSPYSFRHLFVTDALTAGIPLATVAELAGHASTEMIGRVYSHLSRESDHLRNHLESVRGSTAGAPDPGPVPPRATKRRRKADGG